MIRHCLAPRNSRSPDDLRLRAHPPCPPAFRRKRIHSPEGADIFVRWGGTGPVVVLIHGYAENSDSWAPLAADLMKDHTVVVPDLRGIGRSSKPAGGYDKKTQAKDIRAVVTALGFDKTFCGRSRHRQHGRLRLRCDVSGQS